MIATLWRGLDAWIFEAYRVRAKDLAIYRILYASFMLVSAVPFALWAGDFPDAFFSPPLSAAALFDTFPSRATLVALNIALATFLSMLLVGLFTPVASIGVTATLIALNTWVYALGKINHDILVVITPAVLAFSGWGSALSLDAARRPQARDDGRERGSWSLALLAFVIALAMLTAGWAKLSTGWLDPDRRATYGHLLHNYYAAGRHTVLGAWSAEHLPGWAWKACDWSTVLLEMGFVAAMFRANAMRALLAAACLFHLAVWLMFDIAFWASVIAYGAFLPYSRVLRAGPAPALSARFGYLVLAAAWMLAILAIAHGDAPASVANLPLRDAVLIAGAALGAGALARSAYARVAPLLRGRVTASCLAWVPLFLAYPFVR